CLWFRVRVQKNRPKHQSLSTVEKDGKKRSGKLHICQMQRRTCTHHFPDPAHSERRILYARNGKIRSCDQAANQRADQGLHHHGEDQEHSKHHKHSDNHLLREHHQQLQPRRQREPTSIRSLESQRQLRRHSAETQDHPELCRGTRHTWSVRHTSGIQGRQLRGSTGKVR